MSSVLHQKESGENISLVGSYKEKRYEEMNFPLNNLTHEESSNDNESNRKSLGALNSVRSEEIEESNIDILISISEKVLFDLQEFVDSLKGSQSRNECFLTNIQILKNIDNIKTIKKLTENLSQFISNNINAHEQENIIQSLKILNNKPIDDFESQDIKFKGYFDENKQNGFGLIETQNLIYVGCIENRAAMGFGISIYNNQEVYIGEWKNGFRNGDGCYFHSCGQKYIGNFSNGKKNGMGKSYYTNDDRYEGHFKDNYKDGHGIYFHSKTKVYEDRIWKEGR